MKLSRRILASPSLLITLTLLLTLATAAPYPKSFQHNGTTLASASLSSTPYNDHSQDLATQDNQAIQAQSQDQAKAFALTRNTDHDCLYVDNNDKGTLHGRFKRAVASNQSQTDTGSDLRAAGSTNPNNARVSNPPSLSSSLPSASSSASASSSNSTSSISPSASAFPRAFNSSRSTFGFGPGFGADPGTGSDSDSGLLGGDPASPSASGFPGLRGSGVGGFGGVDGVDGAGPASFSGEFPDGDGQLAQEPFFEGSPGLAGSRGGRGSQPSDFGTSLLSLGSLLGLLGGD